MPREGEDQQQVSGLGSSWWEKEPDVSTSVTTGRPKGAALSQSNIRTNVETALETLFDMGPDDVVFGGLPLFHSFGQTCAMNTTIASGATLDLLPRFEASEALRLIAHDHVTVFMGVPTMYTGLLNVPDRAEYDTSSLRFGVSGGASLPREVLRGFEEAFGVGILEGYGLSETSPVATFNHPDRAPRPGSVGTPIRGVELCLMNLDGNIVDEPETIGEICVRGDNVMQGYWKNEDATREAMRGGWFHTGDLATRDADGYYTIVDRKKDMIIRNGFNVYPREVEEVLFTHPDVVEAAVLGIPNPAVGEEIGALVTLREGATTTPDELRAWMKEQVAAYKYPRRIRIGGLPKGPTGKILKREIDFD